MSEKTLGGGALLIDLLCDETRIVPEKMELKKGKITATDCPGVGYRTPI